MILQMIVDARVECKNHMGIQSNTFCGPFFCWCILLRIYEVFRNNHLSAKNYRDRNLNLRTKSSHKTSVEMFLTTFLLKN